MMRDQFEQDPSEEAFDNQKNSNNTDGDWVSKSQVKRELAAITDLGEELIALPPAKLKKLTLSETTRAAIEDAQAIKQHIARKRQTKRVGKLLREEDIELLKHQLHLLAEGRLAASSSQGKKPATNSEVWTQKITDQGDAAINKLLDEQPQLERQTLRQLARQINKAAKPEARKKAEDKLAQYLSRSGIN